MTSPIRLPQPSERGLPFSDWLLDHEPNRATRDRVRILLEQWDVVRDELAREPTIREYAGRWRIPEAPAYRGVSEFRRVFDAEPGEIVSLLWDGVGQQQHEHDGLVPLLRVRVVPR